MRIHRNRLSIVSVSKSLMLASLIVGTGCVEPYKQGYGAGTGIEPDVSNPKHGEVPAEGTAKKGLEVVDDVIQQWMGATCAGAVSISLGVGETPLLARGYGHKDGPPNVNCQLFHPDDPLFVESEKTTPNTPFRVGSVSKPILAAVVRDVLKGYLAELGRPATDAELESLRVFDPALDLVSPLLRRALVNPATVVDGKPVCIAWEQQPNGERIVAGGGVDPRWADITVGQLLSHRSGLPREGNFPYTNIGEVRGVTTVAAFEEQEALSLAPEHARTALTAKGGGARFIPGATLEEHFAANANLCFAFDPGGSPPEKSSGYSNLGFGLLQHIAEHVSNTRFAAPVGADAVHGSTLLGRFVKEKLGVSKGQESKHGIYFSQPTVADRDPAEPEYRMWNGQSIFGYRWDRKRANCSFVASEGRLDCSLFVSGGSRYHWGWEEKPVQVSFENEGFMPGVGLLAAEMPILQRFIARYWVSGDAALNYYGRERATNPSPRTHEHHGALDGSIATVLQVNGDVRYTPYPRDPDGRVVFGAIVKDMPTTTCKLPTGLNVALAANQSGDASCNGDSCIPRYEALRELVKGALCEVDWLKVNPQLASK